MYANPDFLIFTTKLLVFIAVTLRDAENSNSIFLEFSQNLKKYIFENIHVVYMLYDCLNVRMTYLLLQQMHFIWRKTVCFGDYWNNVYFLMKTTHELYIKLGQP